MSSSKLYTYKGENLLNYEGKVRNFRGFGSFVVRKIFPTPEERMAFCFSPRRKHKSIRKRALLDAEKAFKGFILLCI